MDVDLKRRPDAKLEVHDAYIDIQVLVAGTEESFGWSERKDLRQPLGTFDTQKDIQFFDDEPQTYYTLRPGQFTMLLPEDGHAPMVGEGISARSSSRSAGRQVPFRTGKRLRLRFFRSLGRFSSPRIAVPRGCFRLFGCRTGFCRTRLHGPERSGLPLPVICRSRGSGILRRGPPACRRCCGRPRFRRRASSRGAAASRASGTPSTR